MYSLQEVQCPRKLSHLQNYDGLEVLKNDNFTSLNICTYDNPTWTFQVKNQEQKCPTVFVYAVYTHTHTGEHIISKDKPR